MVLGTTVGSNGGDETLSDSGYILKEMLGEFTGRLDMRYKRRRANKMAPGICA